MKQVMITGIHGFVGSNLVAHLSGRYNLCGLSHSPREMEGVMALWGWDVLEDEGKQEGVEGLSAVDAIVHLAGIAHDTREIVNRENYLRVNVGLTERVFDYFMRSKAERFIFFSSVKAVAESVDGAVLTEDAEARPAGPYGESKRMAEEYILGRMAECERMGKRVYVLRPTMIHGAGNKGNLNLLYDVVRRGMPWPLGSFENRRSFVSVDNVNFVVERLLAGEVESGVYNVADDEALSTNEVICVVCGVLGRKPRIWKLGKGMMRECAKVGGRMHLPLNEERMRKLTENYVVSNEKLKRALGVERMPVEAREGLERTIKSFING